jgi:hypothetical protein
MIGSKINGGLDMVFWQWQIATRNSAAIFTLPVTITLFSSYLLNEDYEAGKKIMAEKLPSSPD